MRGKVSATRLVEHAGVDHPRLCGEKWKTVPHPVRSPGSPPPMRGKAVLAAFHASVSGITPAYAGKSARWLQGQPLL